MESIKFDIIDDLANEFLKSLYLVDEGDVTIKLSDGSTINVISYILKHKSTVFYDMLNTEMTEKINSIIDMTTYNPSTVKCFFAYIYFNGVYNGNNIDIFFELFFLARQYKINELYIELEEKIIERINYDTIQRILRNCKKCGDICDEIYKAGLVFVRQHVLTPCYDKTCRNHIRWCCRHFFKDASSNYDHYYVNFKYACICYKLKTKHPYDLNTKGMDFHLEGKPIPEDAFTDRCCLHQKQKPSFSTIKDLEIDIKDDILEYLYTCEN